MLAGCATPIGDAADWQQFSAGDGTRVSYRQWLPAGTPKTVLQVVHGAAEHSSRYDRFAKLAVASGYAVYATDHRGHGHTRLRSGKPATPAPTPGTAWLKTRSRSVNGCGLPTRAPSLYFSATASARSWRRTTSSAAPTCWTG
jgi:alpha-beta hydrolase superfamily lysophospholipase